MYRSVAVAGTLLLGMSAGLPAQPPKTDVQGDERLRQIQQFFKRHACPVESFAHEFLAAADRYGLDWRLLPSLAFIESRGGHTGQGNNVFGWGRVRFESVTDAIHSVARDLTQSRLYQGKTLDEKLKTFNPITGFIDHVHRIMGQIGTAPTPRVEPARGSNPAAPASPR